MKDKNLNQRSKYKPNQVFVPGLKEDELGDIGENVVPEDKPEMKPLPKEEEEDPIEYNRRIIETPVHETEFMEIPFNKLLIRLLKTPYTPSKIKIVKNRIITTEAGRALDVLDDRPTAEFMYRALVVKIGSGCSDNIKKSLEVGDIIDLLPLVDYNQYAVALHKENLKWDNFYLIPDTHFSYIWKTKERIPEHRISTSYLSEDRTEKASRTIGLD